MQNIINFNYVEFIARKYANESSNNKIKMNTFKEAMTHFSGNNFISYDRLEYLGDSVFHMIITEYLFNRYEDDDEGFLTRLRIRIERGDSMTEIASIIGLNKYIQTNCVNLTDDILEDVFEAFIGAYYINFGIKSTQKLVIYLIEKYKDLSEIIAYDDNYKDILLRYYHKKQWSHPTYQESIHGNKFVSVVKNPSGETLGVGSGKTKLKAEQNASEKALLKLGLLHNDNIDEQTNNIIEKKQKKKDQKKSLPIYNPYNFLITKNDIHKILDKYKVLYNKSVDINISTFYEAMTHQSYVNNPEYEKNKSIYEIDKNTVPLQKKSNSRLKFLGDSIIHFIIADNLYFTYRDKNEGFLTIIRARLENRESLFHLTKESGVIKYVLVSQNIEVLHGRKNAKIYSSAFEAFVGALMIEYGFDVAKEFIVNVIRREVKIDDIVTNETNYKHSLLQLFDKKHWSHPEYTLLSESGPDHLKHFAIGIYRNNELLGTGEGTSKRKAEQLAAKEAYYNLTNIEL